MNATGGIARTESAHTVQFYETEDHLTEIVGSFVAEGLARDEAVIVIATEPHRRQFEAHLQANGVDVDAARASSRLLMLDTDEALARFMVDGAPDPQRFRDMLDAAITLSTRGDAAVAIRAYGEMVDVLWRRGEPSAALALERLWNDAQRDRAFALLCAYVMGSFDKEAGELQRVSASHPHVVEEPRAEGEALPVRAIADALPVLVSHIGRDHRYRYVNRAYERWFGVSADEVVGRPMREVLGEDAYLVLRPHVDAALRGELVRFEREIPYRGGARYVDATYQPARGASGAIDGVIALVDDITERRRLDEVRQQHLHRTQQLVHVTGAIAEAVSPTQVFSAIVDEVGAAVHASSVGLFMLDEVAGGVRLVRSVGYQEDAKPRLAFTPLDRSPSLPATDCIRTGEPVWIESRDELLAAYPHLAAVTSPGRRYRIACLPVIARDRAIACLAMTFDDAPSLEPAERDFLRLATRYAGQALERLRLLDTERHVRERAEAAAARTQVLAEASRAFSLAGASVEAALGIIVAQLTAQHVDACSVWLVPDEGDQLEFAAGGHRDPALTDEVVALWRSRPVHLGQGYVGKVAQTGAPMFIPHLEVEALIAIPPSPYRTWLEDHPPHGMMAVPLRAAGKVLGVIAAARERGSPAFAAEDFTLVESVAERAALALQNAQLQLADQRARTRAELLYGMAREVIVATRVEDVYDAALRAIEAGLGAARASILTYGGGAAMRFRAWRGLSDAYRAAVDGHSPWTPADRHPAPIVVADVRDDAAMAPYREVFADAGIGALAFIPMVSGDQLLGKFMVYYDAPRRLRADELDLARAIADHVAAAVARFDAVEGLRETVRFNEMFTGILGHDLRNPLGAILTAAQLAIARNPGERIIKPLSRVLTSGARMTRMIEQLLDFTRVRVGGGIPIHPQAMDLVTIVRQVIDELEDAHPDRTLRLETTGSTHGSWDADRLGQVFSNLIANAIQHGGPTDPIRVAVDGSEPDRLRVSIRNAGEIPAELVPTIFEPMSGSQRRRDGSRGLGLGLHVTREIVRAHHGTIEVSSTPEAGTTFTLDLPRSPLEPADRR